MLLGCFLTNGEYSSLKSRNSEFKQTGAKISSLGEAFWKSLRRHPYGLTEASVVISANALSSISAALCGEATMTPLRVQYSSGVICIDEIHSESTEDTSASDNAAAVPSKIIAVKRTIGSTRFLFLLSPNMLYSTAESTESIQQPIKDVVLSSPESCKQVLGLSINSGILDLAPLNLSGILSYTNDNSSLLVHSVSNDLSKIGVTSLEKKFEGLCSWIRRFLRSEYLKSFESSSKNVSAIEINSFWELEMGVAVGREPRFNLIRKEDSVGQSWVVKREYVDLMLMEPASGNVSSMVSKNSEDSGGPTISTLSLKRPRDKDDSETRLEKIREVTSSISILPSNNMNEVILAVIVPFRDQPEQNRALQLSRFSERLPAFLRTVQPKLGGFHVIIVQQSNDGYKFNRGKALNVGFVMATALNRADVYGSPFSKRFNAFCFHDVDLLPGHGLGPWYAKRPDRPIHIGSAWGRYPYPNYIGGILTLSERDVLASNGFPNNFWGWGGEDDEMFARLRDAKLLPVEKVPPSIANSVNIIEDLEETIIQERGGERAGTSVKDGGRAEWRNMLKHEGIDRHATTWRSNGVNAVDFTATKVVHVNNSVTIVTVDLHGERDEMSQKQTREEIK